MADSQAFFTTYDTLTAPGSGQSTSVQIGESITTKTYSLFTTVASNVSGVVVALNGSIDGTNWSKIIADQTITGNTTIHHTVADVPVKYVQPVFVSESGGTSATVLFSVGASD